jgi:hypothetical protein
MAPEGHGGDLLFQISTLAGIEPLLALHRDADCRVSLKGVWEEVTDVTGLYCIFVTEAIATILLKLVPGVSVDDITIPDAPEADADPLRFFVHPPSDLEEMRALAKSPAGVAGRSAFARPGAGRRRAKTIAIFTDTRANDEAGRHRSVVDGDFPERPTMRLWVTYFEKFL